MLTLSVKYTGNKKFGLYGFFKDWVVVSRCRDEMAAAEMIQKYKSLFKGFEFKFE